MNPLNRIFCRVFQAVFRLAMPLLPYRKPVIYHQVTDVAAELKRRRITSVLLVTDGYLRESGATAALEASLQDRFIRCAVYDGTRPNPTVTNVEEAVALYRKEQCQALIAFGGGSSMDCAKAAGARLVYPKKTVNQLRGLLKVLKRLPPLFAIPTTAGTGSEVTVTAVITDSEKRHKYTMNNFSMIPHYAVLDPEVTVTLPKHLTATTGMDALTHAVEAYIGRSTTKETRRLALEAVELIFGNIETAYADGADRHAREQMLLAAHKAGIAFSKSYVGYIHAVAHSLGGAYNIPHGLANAVLMPIVLEEYGPCIYPKLRELAVAAGVVKATTSEAVAAKLFIQAIRDMNRRMGIPETLSGIQELDIPAMARHAAGEANPLYPVPRLMNAAELELFYHKVSSGAEQTHISAA